MIRLTIGVIVILLPGLWIGIEYNSMPISIPVVAASTLIASNIVSSKKLFNKLDKKDKKDEISDS